MQFTTLLTMQELDITKLCVTQELAGIYDQN